MTIPAALSFWARANRRAARFLIAFATTALILSASALANLWMKEGLRMGPGVLAGIFAVYLLVFPLYPVVRRRTNWVRRKTFDVVLVGCTALLGMWLGVQEVAPRLPLEGSPATAAVVHRRDADPAASRAPAQRFGQKVKRGMSLLRAVFHRPAAFGDPFIFSRGAKIGLSILTVVLMLGLMTLLVAVSCSLSCSGNAVGGTLVLVLGWIAVIALGTFALIRINRGEAWLERRRGSGG